MPVSSSGEETILALPSWMAVRVRHAVMLDMWSSGKLRFPSATKGILHGKSSCATSNRCAPTPVEGTNGEREWRGEQRHRIADRTAALRSLWTRAPGLLHPQQASWF